MIGRNRVNLKGEREKIDWQEARKFDCRLESLVGEGTILIFCCPSRFRQPLPALS